MKKVNNLIIAILVLSTGQGFANQIPYGTYINSCYNIQAYTENAPYRLQATCADAQGNYKQTVLDSFDNCYIDIENKNGVLTCPVKAKPNNFYLTCEKVTVNQRLLNALCQDSKGRYQATALYDFLSCPSQIQNIDGQLQCS